MKQVFPIISAASSFIALGCGGGGVVSPLPIEPGRFTGTFERFNSFSTTRSNGTVDFILVADGTISGQFTYSDATESGTLYGSIRRNGKASLGGVWTRSDGIRTGIGPFDGTLLSKQDGLVSGTLSREPDFNLRDNTRWTLVRAP